MTVLDDAAQPTGEPQGGELQEGALREGELSQQLQLISALALAQRAEGFLQLHDELLAELERSDQPAAVDAEGAHA